MKKLFVGLAATVMAAAMCASLVGCGGVDAKSVKGYEVTEEQWIAACEALEKDDAVYTIKSLEKSDVTMEVDLSQILPGGKKMSGGAKGTEETTYVKNGALEYVKSTTKAKLSGDYEEIMKTIMGDDYEANLEEEEETYAELKDGAWTYYEKNEEGAWEKDTGYGSIMWRSYRWYKNSYSDFEYSAEHKGYIEKDYDPADEEAELLVIKFNKDAQLVAVYMEANYDEEETGMKYTGSSVSHYVIEYKAKDITLPTVAE